mgnify:CR=1 FL=1
MARSCDVVSVPQAPRCLLLSRSIRGFDVRKEVAFLSSSIAAAVSRSSWLNSLQFSLLRLKSQLSMPWILMRMVPVPSCSSNSILLLRWLNLPLVGITFVIQFRIELNSRHLPLLLEGVFRVAAFGCYFLTEIRIVLLGQHACIQLFQIFGQLDSLQ